MNVTCNYCSKNFATEQDFNVHTERFHQIAHSTNKLISCEYCSLKFKTMENFVDHVHACVWKIMTAKMIEHASFYNMVTREQPLNLKVIPPTSSLTTSTVEPNYTEQNLSNPTATVPKAKKLKKTNYALYETACDNCFKRFKCVRDLIAHKKICEAEKIKVVPLASSTTSNAEQNSTEENLSNPVNEVRKLNGENNEVISFQIPCKNCPMKFKYVKELVAHKKTCEAEKYKTQVMPVASLTTSNVEQNSITKQNSSYSTEVCNVTKPDYHLFDNRIFSTPTPTSSKVYCVQKEDNSEDNSYDSSQIYYSTKSQSDTISFPSKSLFSDKSSVNVKAEQLSNYDKLCYTPPYTPTVHCENYLPKFDKATEHVVHSQTCEMRNNACAMILPQCISDLRQFPSLEALNIHFSQCVKKDEIYKCPACEDPFGTNHEFQAHFPLYCLREERRNKWE